MELLVTLPAKQNPSQPARQGVVTQSFQDHSMLFEARDGLKPATLHVPASEFPWAHFIGALLTRWELSRPVPKGFAPLRRIPQEVLDALSIVPVEEGWRILDGLRSAQFLPKLSVSPNTPRAPTTTVSSQHPPKSLPNRRKTKPGGMEPEWG